SFGLVPIRPVRTEVARGARAQCGAGLRRGRSAPAPRWGPPTEAPPRSARIPGSLRTARPPGAARRKAALRLHSRQLVFGQRPRRPTLVRRGRRDPAAVRDRLLRRLHFPLGARRITAEHRQPDLLARRRSLAAAR